MSGRTITRLIGGVVALAVALSVSFSLLATNKGWQKFEFAWAVIIAVSVVIGFIGWLITPGIISALREQIRRASVSDLIAGVVGLVAGLLVALLVAIPLAQIPAVGGLLPSIAALLCAYLGVTIGVTRKDDFVRLATSAWTSRAARRAAREEHAGDGDDEHEEREEPMRLRDRLTRKSTRTSERILVDTSSIIDGRIADIAQTGFITGTLVTPRFVLEELQHIADSADSLRRNRGRRGLDVLQRLQKDSNVSVEISDADVENTPEVDAKLVKLARQWRCSIITNDFNLNRVAELQGVKVLNINELAHAVKPIVLPGEDMEIKIMQDGKEYGQGVGYLDDGTMIVVEGGRAYMGSTVEVTVTRVLQTVAGRMIFAQPKHVAAAPNSTALQQRRTGTA